MTGDADLAALGSVLGERARARMLLALGDGRALPAGVLASEAGVAASTASQHLGRLVDAGVLALGPPGPAPLLPPRRPAGRGADRGARPRRPHRARSLAPRRYARARDQDRAYV